MCSCDAILDMGDLASRKSSLKERVVIVDEILTTFLIYYINDLAR